MTSLPDEVARYEPLEIADEGEINDDMSLRRAMLDIRRCQQEQQRLKMLLHQITDVYRRALQDVDAQEDVLREMILAYMRHRDVTTLGFPDVGRAQVRSVAAKVTIEDVDVVKKHYGDRFVRTSFDETEFRKWALANLVQTGELIDGTTLVPEHPIVALTFR